MQNIRFWPKFKEGDGGASRDHVATGRMGALSIERGGEARRVHDATWRPTATLLLSRRIAPSR
ncbi:hypothetical protein Taro_018281 [Colocasia esculenta]|uniref:Uncharacterized protein n=1 Tax=Colocasia esculenta TaxID=4460 RepID=A0A843UTD9_COLES|nr:hypothetical protein [Colocasia esculenta]